MGGGGGDFDADGVDGGKPSKHVHKGGFIFIWIVYWEIVLFGTDDSDTEEEVKEEEESIGKKEGAPPVSNEVQAMA